VQAELGLGLCDQALRTTRELIKANPNGEGAIKAYVLRAKAPLYLLWPYSPCTGAALLTLRTSHFFQLTSYCVQALLFSSDLEQSAKHLREALRLDPDAAEAGRALKKVRGREP
jgi:tetratricopeptide (TPR) repeat protein